jgi:hypothetical protein
MYFEREKKITQPFKRCESQLVLFCWTKSFNKSQNANNSNRYSLRFGHSYSFNTINFELEAKDALRLVIVLKKICLISTA